MYRCPHCRNKSIPTSALWAYQARSTCKACGAEVRMRIKPSTFLLPAFLLARAVAGIAFDLRLAFATEMVVMVALVMLQFYLFEFRVAEPQPR